MATTCTEGLRPHASPYKTNQSSCQNDERKGHIQGKNSHETCRSDGQQQIIFQCTRAYAMSCLNDDGCHCRLDAIEQTSYPSYLTVGDINPRQSYQEKQRRQHKQNTSHNTALCFVHQPANVGGQLLGFWSGQDHAVIECMQETFFRKPTPAHHQLFVHDGNLASRPTKTDESQLQPKGKGLPKTHRS